MSKSTMDLNKDNTKNSYNLSAFKNSLGVAMNNEEAMDLLFYCPFEFPEYKKK
jgi:hypothetical protein